MEVERSGQHLGVELINYLQIVSLPVGHALSLLNLKGSFPTRVAQFSRPVPQGNAFARIFFSCGY
jgi:hypothetical protein